MPTRKTQFTSNGEKADSAQVDPGRRAFLRGALGLAGLAVAGKLSGCADAGGQSRPGQACSSSELPASCSYLTADSARCAVWNNRPIELDGIFFYINNLRREGAEMKAEIEVRIPALGCEFPTLRPTTITIPATGAFTVQGRGYYVTIYNAWIDEDPVFSWADAEVSRFYTYCDYGTVRQTLTAGESTDTISSRDGKFSLRLLGAEEGGRAAFRILDSAAQDRGILVLREGEVKFGQVGDKVYPITAHVVVAGTSEMASCAEISISTCSELPHGSGIEFSW